MPVKGANTIRKNFLVEVGKIHKVKSPQTMQKVLIIGSSNASILTPVDTANLINSQVKKIEITDGGVRGAVGYTATNSGFDYGIFVHEAERLKFQKSSAESEFLRRGFEEKGIREIKNAIYEGYRV